MKHQEGEGKIILAELMPEASFAKLKKFYTEQESD